MKKIIAIVVIVSMLAILAGCGKDHEETENKRFEMKHRESIGTGSYAYIIKDTQTDELYLYIHAGYSGGLTPLKEGKE